MKILMVTPSYKSRSRPLIKTRSLERTPPQKKIGFAPLLEVLFNLNATRKLLSVSGKLSKDLQAVGISADYALYSVKHVIQRFTEMRCAEEFESTLKEANNFLGLTGDTDGPRHSKIPKRLDDSVIFSRLPAREEVNISKMRQSYYGAINAPILSLQKDSIKKNFQL